jgi:hypothetical protein
MGDPDLAVRTPSLPRPAARAALALLLILMPLAALAPGWDFVDGLELSPSAGGADASRLAADEPDATGLDDLVPMAGGVAPVGLASGFAAPGGFLGADARGADPTRQSGPSTLISVIPGGGNQAIVADLGLTPGQLFGSPPGGSAEPPGVLPLPSPSSDSSGEPAPLPPSPGPIVGDPTNPNQPAFAPDFSTPPGLDLPFSGLPSLLAPLLDLPGGDPDTGPGSPSGVAGDPPASVAEPSTLALLLVPVLGIPLRILRRARGTPTRPL